MSFRNAVLLPVFAALAISLGCSSTPTRVNPPAFVPGTAAAEAIKLYDTNSDGALDKKELEKCPSILAAIALYDKNSDGKVDAEEITARLQAILDQKIGITTMQCRVMKMQGGRKVPVVGANVKFVPEKFMGDALKPAESTEPSSEAGIVTISIAEGDRREGEKSLTGIYPGLYKVEITHPTEKILPKFSGENTVFGQEASNEKGGVLDGAVEFVVQ